jgi:hypothetical protein
VAYCSRQLNSAETKYSITELELLAVIFAVKQFRCYLYGRQFIVYTDHRALRWLLNLQDPSSRLTRWAVKLSEYGFIVEHRSNPKMRHADALSRCVQLVLGDYSLTKEDIKEAQEKDSLCEKYKTYEKFWLDEDQVLYCTVLAVLVRFTDQATQLLTILYLRLHWSLSQSVRNIWF